MYWRRWGMSRVEERRSHCCCKWLTERRQRGHWYGSCNKPGLTWRISVSFWISFYLGRGWWRQRLRLSCHCSHAAMVGILDQWSYYALRYSYYIAHSRNWVQWSRARAPWSLPMFTRSKMSRIWRQCSQEWVQWSMTKALWSVLLFARLTMLRIWKHRMTRINLCIT